MKLSRVCAASALLLLSGFGYAQPSARTAPDDPAAPVPQTRYESSLTGYQSYGEQPLRSWKDANDEVGRAGGHRGHASQSPTRGVPQAAVPRSAPAPDSRPPSAPQVPAQGGHEKH